MCASTRALAPGLGGLLNPAIVIPSYWTSESHIPSVGEWGAYDYATPITKPMPELETCLSSLEQVRGVLRIFVLVVADPECENSARARVNSICRSHPNLDTLVIGAREAFFIKEAVAKLVPNLIGENVALRGYGAIKNLGLTAACVFGHDAVVFLDDDEVVTSPNFLIDAVYGLGLLTRQNLKILCKSGYFVDKNGSCYAKPSTKWSEKYWSKAAGFNAVMKKAQEGTRISRSNHMSGGCCAIHAQAFTRVPFDPFITRGEDLDYVLNLRANGMDVWFDNEWSVRLSLPDEMAPEPSLFMQDVYRWLYEYRKLAAMNARRNLRTITPDSLMPYPAPWLSEGVRTRVFKTALRRLVTGPYRRDYLAILTKGAKEADAFATQSAEKYLKFAMSWQTVMTSLWQDKYLQNRILGTGGVAQPAATVAPQVASAVQPASAPQPAAEGGLVDEVSQ